MTAPYYVLRTIYIDPRLDERLKSEAFSANISKNELIRRYLEVGISAVDTGKEPPVTKRVRGVNNAAFTPSKESVAASTKLLKKAREKVALGSASKAPVRGSTKPRPEKRG